MIEIKITGEDYEQDIRPLVKSFYPEDVIGKTVIIHALSDDFKTQPSGDAGEMIACGEIMEQEQ